MSLSTFKLEIPNQLSGLTQLADWVAEVSDRLGLGSKDRYRLDLVLSEAVTNIIEYAFEDSAEHAIRLEGQLADGQLVVQVTDDGRPFNPLDQGPPAPLRSVEEAPIGGLGIYFIRQFADACRYSREDGSNRLTLTLEIGRPR